jgi:hypothetical protein
MTGVGVRTIAMALLVGVLGCDREPPREPPELPPKPRAAPEKKLERELAALAEEAGIVPADPEPPAGDLKAEIARFTSVEACIDAHAPKDPVIGDAIDALGYDTLTRDACRTVEALHEKDAKKCAPILASALRARCEASVATLVGDAELCPMSGAGRDPVCLARARRDVRLCGAALASDRAACKALVSGDASACGKDAACARQVERWKPLLEAAAPHKPYEAKLAIELHAAKGSEEPATTAFDLEDVAAAGVVVRKTAGRGEIVLGTPRDPSWLAIDALDAAPRAFVSVSIPPGASEGTKVPIGALTGRFEILLPKVASLSSLTALPGGEITLVKLSDEAGAPIAFDVKATVTDGPRAYELAMHVKTFVRDVVGQNKPMEK